MPNGRKLSRRIRKTKARSRRRTPKSSNNGRNPIRSLVVTGVRTIVSALPFNTVILPIVDMVFSAIGFTSATYNVKSDSVAFQDVQVYGLSAILFPTYVNILSRTPQAARNTTKGPRLWVDTPFNDGKLTTFTAKALPDNQRGKRSGKWSMVFVPFRNVNDLKELAGDYQPLDQRQVQAMPGSITANADQPLTMTFRPTPEDGFIFQYNKLDQAFGALIVAYSNEIRAGYVNFTAEDFAPNIQFSGTIKLRQPILKGGVVGFEDIPVTLSEPPVIKVQLGTAHTYKNVSDKWNVSIARSGCTIEENTKDIKNISGTVFTPKLAYPSSTCPKVLTLEDMVLG